MKTYKRFSLPQIWKEDFWTCWQPQTQTVDSD